MIPANPKVVGSRPYTGNSDGASAGPLPGMDEWIRQAIKYGAGASVTGNGSAAAANTASGGGGSADNSTAVRTGGAGGSGIIYVRFKV